MTTPLGRKRAQGPFHTYKNAVGTGFMMCVEEPCDYPFNSESVLNKELGRWLKTTQGRRWMKENKI